MGTNKLISQTSLKKHPDRSHVEGVIKILEKNRLIKRTKIGKQGTIIQELDELGEELAQFSVGIQEYIESCDNFQKSARETFEVLKFDNRDVSTQSLKCRGWNDEEIDLYDDCTDSVCRIEDVLARNMTSPLIYRYASILARFGVDDAARAILTKIVVDGLTQQLLIIQQQYSKDAGKSYNILNAERMNYIHGSFAEPILQEIREAYSGSCLSANHFIKNDIEKVFSSILNILRLEDFLISTLVILQYDDIKAHEHNNPPKTKYGRKIFEMELRDMKHLFDIYENYICKSPVLMESYVFNIMHLKRNNPNGALVLLDRILSTNPKVSYAWFGKGKALMKLQRIDEAITCFGHAIDIDPVFLDAIYNRASCYLSNGDIQNCIADLGTCVQNERDKYVKLIEKDTAFENLKTNHDFNRMLKLNR
jgi:tetratricopeptide (TPR) repeat protein